jgi:PleD family two-component response regulator
MTDTTRPPRAGLDVLIVGADDVTQRALKSRLARCGIAAAEAGDAIAAVRALSGTARYGAVVLSTSVAGVAPSALARWLRLRPETAGVRLVVLADEDAAASAAAAYRAGAALVLPTPVDPGRLADRVAALMKPATVYTQAA